MSKAVAKRGDRVLATDTHLVIPPGGGPPVPVSLPYDGVLTRELSPDVFVDHEPVALAGSVAVMSPTHQEAPNTFVKPPSHQGRVIVSAPTVFANGIPIARDGDVALTCNDPTDLPVGKVVVMSGSVHTL
jgi:uncharacterized Zn-binding protein involved in type VI secretion